MRNKKQMLSVIIPARNEKFLNRTVEGVLKAAAGDIEVVVILDGYGPDVPVVETSQVKVIRYEKPRGLRVAVNNAAKRAKGEFIMKIDAHTVMDDGFDVKLAEDCEYNWTVVPRMYALDAFHWRPIWEIRTDFIYLDFRMRNQYWPSYERREEAQGDIVDLMCCQGNCWFQHKDRFLELGGLDEGYGFYGQLGIEVALKAWLTGGRMVVNKNTWFAHLFRGGKVSKFPYEITGYDIEMAKRYSRDLWLNNKWHLQKRRLGWLIDRFAPVPSWGPIERKAVA